MKNKYENKKYNVPKRRLNGVSIAYITSIGLLTVTMAIILIIVPNQSDKNDYVSEEYSTSSTNRYSHIVSNWFSERVPQDNPIASSITSSQTSQPTQTPSSSESFSESSSSSVVSTSESSSTPPSTSAESNEQPIQSTQSTQASQSSQSTQSSQSVQPAPKPEQLETNADGKVQYDKDGIVIVGNRAFSLYSAGTTNCANYANVLNQYKAALPNVNVYSMVIPTACEFYSPTDVARRCTSQKQHINAIYANLNNVTGVDAYSALASHADEEIYLRTDHHWAALGGYYSAEAFAKAAGVPFLQLSDYTRCVNTGYVGTMYGYTNKNSILLNNPENFVYHIPKTVDYTTTYYNYKLSGGSVSGAYEPMKAAFFLNYGDNASDNYCTFMGGDAKIVHVKTNTNNGRKLAIFKDSFGNTIPGYLFGSFEEIYVMDLRYFSHNAVDYLTEKGITDLLFANNTTVTANRSMTAKLKTLLTQADMGF